MATLGTPLAVFGAIPALYVDNGAGIEGRTEGHRGAVRQFVQRLSIYLKGKIESLLSSERTIRIV